MGEVKVKKENIMLSQRESENCIRATENQIKYYKQTTVQSILNLRAMRRDLANYKEHLKFWHKQMSLAEVK